MLGVIAEILIVLGTSVTFGGALLKCYRKYHKAHGDEGAQEEGAEEATEDWPWWLWE